VRSRCRRPSSRSFGVVAQVAERLPCMQQAAGATPADSTLPGAVDSRRNKPVRCLQIHACLPNRRSRRDTGHGHHFCRMEQRQLVWLIIPRSREPGFESRSCTHRGGRSSDLQSLQNSAARCNPGRPCHSHPRVAQEQSSRLITGRRRRDTVLEDQLFSGGQADRVMARVLLPPTAGRSGIHLGSYPRHSGSTPRLRPLSRYLRA
jgi:hypothetical protein